MKSSLRCKANHQGDRCKKSRNHELTVQDAPDTLHAGSFAAWEGFDTKDIKFHLVARFLAKAPKRNRVANRFYRATCSKDFNPNLVPHNERKPLLWHLTQLVNHYKGGRA